MSILNDSTQPKRDFEETNFGARPRTGVFMGLHWIQAALVFLVLCDAVFMAVLIGFPLGLVIGLLILAVGLALVLPRINRVPLPIWIFRLVFRRVRASQDQTDYLRKWESQIVAIADPDGEFTAALNDAPRNKKGKLLVPRPIKLHLPGADEQLDLYETPAGFSFIHDRERSLGIIIGKASTVKAFDLESEDRKFVRTKSFNEALISLSAIDGLEVTQFTDYTRLISNEHIRQWYEERIKGAPRMENEDGELVPMAGEHLNELLHQSYLDTIDGNAVSASHSQLVAFAFDQDKLATIIKENGAGIPGFVETVMQRMDTLQTMLQRSGVNIEHWLGPREVGEIIRAAFDPLGYAAISERTGDFAGVAPEVAGPMAVEDYWDHLRTDTGFHRSYWVAEWPRQGAEMGFLKGLVLAGDFAHSVTELVRPIPVDKAMNIIESRKSDWGTTDKFRDKSGRVQSLRHEGEFSDISNQEVEVVKGNAPFYVNGLITVTGTTKSELERFCSMMTDRASIARMEIRPAYGQQASAFVAANLPFCKGISTARIWGF